MALLELRNVSKNFGHYKAMDQVSFNVEAGRIVGLIGPNGAGKSTTMRAITGLMSYSSGDITFDNQPVTFSNHKALDKMGNLIEYPSIYPNLTALDHLNLYAMETKEAVNIPELMHQTGIDGDKFGKRKAKNFSLGMKQRLGIAISLVRNPKLVILDEPMNGLDPQSVHDVRELIRSLANKGVSFLISSHLLDELQRLADDLVIINQGKIIKTASMEEFLQNGQTQILIKTNDNQALLSLTKKYNWQAHLDGDRVIINKVDGMTVQDVLAKVTEAKLEVKTINTAEENLEEHLLNLLKDNKKEEA
ncbi:ABC transporter ATP-binding protein [Convivina praedatoris]|uniref:Bacitracin transport ATP-binding protein BcrA n=1 Tax=Convivina praedatoris TaxID=2880963 RepID=A0ABN8HF82_9LACO|nr:ATP-binding cassette domain-containing protein [Convivina sp. LMG 32447]CAH1855776.1 Bacitracin transport ATP-binding protein BcrA [Convivina sp. LMG 32447]CAH1856718.1 Bacitracin transport ATP-binding protein BcrA [Convivina sp. LMG 32447]CAH1856788.1 Bacitracin transport ATP-binding protein BcrA [Convivina sp. LMG 32447]